LEHPEALVVAAEPAHDQQTTRLIDSLARLTPERQVVGPLGDTWPTLGPAALIAWAVDLRRTLRRAWIAMGKAEAEAHTDDGLAAMEEAMWRLDAAQDKLKALTCLALGIFPLKIVKAGRIRFEPDAVRMSARLEKLTPDYPAAGKLRDLGLTIADHPAIKLRHDVSHRLAPIHEAAEVCWLEIVHIQSGRLHHVEHSRLMPEGLLGRRDINAEALWRDALANAGAAFRLITEMVDHLTTVVGAIGQLQPPVRLYCDESKPVPERLGEADPRWAYFSAWIRKNGCPANCGSRKARRRSGSDPGWTRNAAGFCVGCSAALIVNRQGDVEVFG
jgi:hypothetical protein